MNMLKDINGKESSKRIWASRFLWVGLAIFGIKVFVALVDVFTEKQYTFDFPTEQWLYIMGAGMLAMGFTLAEKKK